MSFPHFDRHDQDPESPRLAAVYKYVMVGVTIGFIVLAIIWLIRSL